MDLLHKPVGRRGPPLDPPPSPTPCSVAYVHAHAIDTMCPSPIKPVRPSRRSAPLGQHARGSQAPSRQPPFRPCTHTDPTGEKPGVRGRLAPQHRAACATAGRRRLSTDYFNRFRKCKRVLQQQCGSAKCPGGVGPATRTRVNRGTFCMSNSSKGAARRSPGAFQAFERPQQGLNGGGNSPPPGPGPSAALTIAGCWVGKSQQTAHAQSLARSVPRPERRAKTPQSVKSP